MNFRPPEWTQIQQLAFLMGSQKQGRWFHKNDPPITARTWWVAAGQNTPIRLPIQTFPVNILFIQGGGEVAYAVDKTWLQISKAR